MGSRHEGRHAPTLRRKNSGGAGGSDSAVRAEPVGMARPCSKHLTDVPSFSPMRQELPPSPFSGGETEAERD